MQIYRDVEAGEQGAWPFRARPLPDELLSSWLVRQAHAHFYKVEKFCFKLFGRGHGLWAADMDRLAGQTVLDTMARITATSRERALATTLRSYALDGRLPEPGAGSGIAPWVVPLHRYHRARLRPGLMYCPLCLGEGLAYYRRAWRLAFNTVCIEHRIDLLDVCPGCKRPVEIHRVDAGPTGRSPREGAVAHCWNCGFDLSWAPAVVCDDGPLEIATLCSRALHDGHIEWAGNPALHAVPFFSGVRQLARLALRHAGPARAQLEELPVTIRRAAIRTLAPWLRDWPRGFLDHVGPNRPFKHSDVANTRQALPYWLERDIAGQRRHQAPKKTATEVAAIVDHLRCERSSASNAARRKLGIHFGKTHIAALRSSVSHEAHESLLKHLDHRIAATDSKVERLARVQDKIMFCLYRFTDWSLSELCGLKLQRMPDLPHVDLSGIWWRAPSNRLQAIKALLDHVQRSRMAIPGASAHADVFVSAHTGRPLGGNALHRRFDIAVTEARLVACIPSMRAYKIESR